MHLADWIVLGLYVVVIVAIGVWANRRQTDTEAYFVGNRSVKWWAAGHSIIATSFSAASILGVPGYAYSTDVGFDGVEKAVIIFGIIAIVYTVRAVSQR